MYHSVSDFDESRHPYYQICTRPEVFAEHTAILHKIGYKTIDLDTAVGTMNTGEGGRSEKTVVITFDDGYRDFYTTAYPILAKYGFSATVFLPTAYISDHRRSFNGRECMTWSEVRKLTAAGVRFGSHTVNHPELKKLSLDRVRQEIFCSRDQIEQRLGCPTTSFSYPYAFPETNSTFVGELRCVLEAAGYGNGVSTIIGTATPKSDRLFMQRIPVNSHDDQSLFRAKLEGAYDWLHGLQRAAKLIARSN